MDLRVCSTREEMGAASAAMAAEAIAQSIQRDGRAVVVFASAVSQNEFLDALASSDQLDWSKVTAFHLDEYIGVRADHPASFRRFLHQKLWSRVQPAKFYELAGEAADVEGEILRYSALLEEETPTIGFLGIGENGHLAFNDPPVDFNDPQLVRVVELDEICRMQQVHDGAFGGIGEVPRTAFTMTIPAILRIPLLILNVPGLSKAEAVRNTVQGPLSPHCPASALQRHPHATLFVDKDAAKLLS
ncbi:MAG: glucosamine-6-phosphate deaminase [Bryobacteraceae bacterium]|nr:glucosamine-6-phosphate deaminase [Bryobacteraceae bacterium]